MSGAHAGPRRDRTRRFTVWPPAGHAAPPPGGTRMPPRRESLAEAVAAGLRARTALTAQADILTRVLPALRNWTPQPVPSRPRPCGGVSAIWVAAITYPAPAASPEEYAAVMRHVSFATGTASRYDEPGAWPRHVIETEGNAA